MSAVTMDVSSVVGQAVGKIKENRRAIENITKYVKRLEKDPHAYIKRNVLYVALSVLIVAVVIIASYFSFTQMIPLAQKFFSPGTGGVAGAAYVLVITLPFWGLGFLAFTIPQMRSVKKDQKELQQLEENNKGLHTQVERTIAAAKSRMATYQVATGADWGLDKWEALIELKPAYAKYTITEEQKKRMWKGVYNQIFSEKESLKTSIALAEKKYQTLKAKKNQ